MIAIRSIMLCTCSYTIDRHTKRSAALPGAHNELLALLNIAIILNYEPLDGMNNYIYIRLSFVLIIQNNAINFVNL